MVDDPRLLRFARGEMSDGERTAFERELDVRPSLRRALVRVIVDGEPPDPPSTREETTRSKGERVGAGAAPLSAPNHGRLALGSTLGEGGMGLVRDGVQTSLGRPVAVKTLRHPTPSGRFRLFQEARLTARLQHPNIVPVHEVVEGPDGDLQVVLKRVEGVRWGGVMRDPRALRELFGVDDPLDWNLGVVIAVCNALAYAHEQGIIHRDVKPSNVMIGRLGEVYLLDWGIAGVFGERREDDDRPHVADSPSSGTPAYMSPEQIAGDADALGPWTDTYLVGASLFTLLTGEPPFSNTDAAAPAERIAEMPTDPAAPRALVRFVVDRLLAADVEKRIVSAEELRSELEAIRRHRGSMALVERAEEHARSARAEGDRERAWQEAEFGFRAALDAWPENVSAREGLRALLVHRVEAALAADTPDVATERLQAIEDPPADLVARVEAARSRAAAQQTEASRAIWEADLRVGLGWRGGLIALFGPLWVGGWIAFAIWPPTTVVPLVSCLLGFFALGTVVVVGRGMRMLENWHNRTNVLGAAIAVAGSALWAVCAERMRLGMVGVYAGIIVVLAVVLGTVAVIADRRAAPPAVWCCVCLGALAFAPHLGAVTVTASALGVAVSTVAFNVLLRRATSKAREP
ncbi:MAG: protein kinase [Deltaproteobacteria bacterium]|nr:protein kinase [Deltaproteobacteria bacterium]